MLRLALGIVLAPLSWPWVAWPVLNIVGGSDWNWPSLFVNPWFLGFGYILTGLIFLPYVLACKRFGKNSVWVYVLGGLGLGALGPIVLVFFYGLISEGVRMSFEFIVTHRHYLAASIVASPVMMTAFWVLGVYNNSLFVKQPNNFFEPTP
jgi:hypothetical protein